LPNDRRREIAVRLLEQQQVAKLRRIAAVGERVLVAALAFERTGIVVERSRLADQVEPDIGERQFLFQQRRVPAPFRQAMAEDQRIIGEPQRVVERRRRHHMSPTSFGTA
jgi:hypothetical protein